MSESKRNPDIYLKMIEQEKQKKKMGKLKIFFGYAAGVGKTYAMLCAADKEKRAGIDIVIGYLEPHARPDTQKKAEGLEILPTKEMKVNRLVVREMDLDAVLRRSPKIVLVDEMAHTNADGCRHPKRYQDILEILNSGIDVYTTLNVQHIESLHDKVAAITGVEVKERIPDNVFDRADQISVVDVAPEELMERLRAGKIYKAEHTAQALSHFFSESNLIALREIALRRMADWLNKEQDEMLVNAKRENASEHIMMCLSAAPSNAKVIRQAAKLADAFHGKMTAFYVESPEDKKMGTADAIRFEENRKLAEKFGAKIVTSFGSNIVEQIAEYAKVSRATKIVLGRTNTRHSLFSVRENIAERLAALVPNLEIFLIPASYEKKYVRKKRKRYQRNQKQVLRDFGISLSILLFMTGFGILFDYLRFEDTNLIMVYVLGSMLTALFSKYYMTGIFYGIAAIVAFNFFFADPRYTFTFYNVGYFVTFIIFFAVSAIISMLVKKVKSIAKQNVEKAYRMGILLETSELLQKDKTREEIAADTARQLGRLLNRSICCFTENPEEGKIPQCYEISGRAIEFSAQERAVAVWSYKNNKSAGATTSTLPGSKNMFLTIRNGEKVFGLIGIDMQGKALNVFEESVMLAILSESALAFEKEEKISKERKMAILLDQKKFRTNLLHAMFYDFRTPLAAIQNDMDILSHKGEDITVQQRRKIYEDIEGDVSWLLNLIENLLYITCIENGTLQLNVKPKNMDDIIKESIVHLGNRVKGHKILYHSPGEVCSVRIDAKLMEQVIVNLVDNAVKHTPADSSVIIRMHCMNGKVQVKISVQGNGVSADQRTKIFEAFYTMEENHAGSRPGMGLGLALCKSVVKAHGGRIWVENNREKGAVFTIELTLFDGVY